MNWKAWAPLIVAVLLGAVALFVAKDALRKNRSTEAGRGNFSQVAVAKRAIAAGQELTAEDLVMGHISDDQTPEGTFSGTGDLLGRVVVSPMVKGQPVMVAFLAEKGAGSGLQAVVPEGMRAVTVEINEFSGVAGFLKTGSHVDVVTSLRESTGNESAAVTIVKDVVVQAVGQFTGSQVANAVDTTLMPRSVTLVVTPEQAEAIELATTIGRVRLTLRGNGDHGNVTSAGVTTAHLRRGSNNGGMNNNDPFDTQATPAIDIKRPTTGPAYSFTNTREVTIIRGTQQSTVTFEQHKPSGLFTDAPTGSVVPTRGQ